MVAAQTATCPHKLYIFGGEYTSPTQTRFQVILAGVLHIHMRVMTDSYVWHDSFSLVFSVYFLIFWVYNGLYKFGGSAHPTWTRFQVVQTHSYAGRDSFMYETCFLHMCVSVGSIKL